MRRPILTALFIVLGSILMPLWADSNYDKQVRELEENISISRRQHNKEELAKNLAARMASFYNTGKVDSIKAHFEEDMKELRHIRQWNSYYEVWTYYINSLIYYANGKNQALREVQMMFADAMEREETYGQGIAYYTMGNVYLNMNNLDQSADAYAKGLEQLLQL